MPGYYLGELLARRGQTDEAIAAAQKVIAHPQAGPLKTQAGSAGVLVQ